MVSSRLSPLTRSDSASENFCERLDSFVGSLIALQYEEIRPLTRPPKPCRVAVCGDVAQRESTAFATRGSRVQIPSSPPDNWLILLDAGSSKCLAFLLWR